MAVAAFADKKTMLATYGTSMEYSTEPYPLGVANYANVVMNLHTLFSSAGTKQLSWTAWGSNDGLNFTSISGLGTDLTATGIASMAADVAFAFMRITFTLIMGSSGGDWGAVCFDCHVNLMRK